MIRPIMMYQCSHCARVFEDQNAAHTCDRRHRGPSRESTPLPGLDLRGLLKGTRIELFNEHVPGKDKLRMNLDLATIDVETNTSPIFVSLHQDIPHVQLEMERGGRVPVLYEIAYSMIREALMHELDEGFWLHGKKVFDPHPKEEKK